MSGKLDPNGCNYISIPCICRCLQFFPASREEVHLTSLTRRNSVTHFTTSGLCLETVIGLYLVTISGLYLVTISVLYLATISGLCLVPIIGLYLVMITVSGKMG